MSEAQEWPANFHDMNHGWRAAATEMGLTLRESHDLSFLQLVSPRCATKSMLHFWLGRTACPSGTRCRCALSFRVWVRA